ncbi:MAG TPA: DUF4097 family beta strand repeat-containing protein [Bryobacteraceae bacterium]|nr:DUF4097 family beta strand repeat-containing protein [Bryobacteraceae bacterium]
MAGEVRAHTGSGRVELVSLKGGVDAHTGSGGIEGTGIAGTIVARTGSGAIRLEQAAQAAVKAHTGSGGVHVEQAVTVKGSVGKNDLNATLRGGGPLLDLSTGSGGIRIE